MRRRRVRLKLRDLHPQALRNAQCARALEVKCESVSSIRFPFVPSSPPTSTMSYTTEELETYLDFAIRLAKLAGPVILEGFNSRFSPERSALLVKKGNTADLVTEWDQKVEKLVRAKIAEEMKEHS